ncbi:MAG: Gfo/Idh/MocA family oxidoreductase [Acidimicrobiia bacterium]|nr:Gfo/Idh/MocA family oxidoreductase [Acidimicrobiia bacterium]
MSGSTGTTTEPRRLRAAVIGAAFAGSLHAESLTATGDVDIAGVVSATEASRQAFVERFGGRGFATVDELLAAEKLDVISLALPNRFHADIAVAAAEHGVAVISEKPLAMNLAEADRMIAACESAGVPLLYAEQLCFAPRYVRVKELIASGSLGDVIQINHWERHGGPHARWFHDPALSGGGVLLDMGCHGIEVARWLLDKQPVKSVHARLGIHKHTDGVVDDHALVTLRFSGGSLAVVDSSWAAPGGIDERIEILGTKGTVSADLARGQSLLVYSDVGIDYAAEKVEHERGWFWVAHNEAHTWGWHGEFAHFVDVLRKRTEPIETGRDGRQVLEIVMAAYRSAAEGREVTLPYHSEDSTPIAPWLLATGAC